MKIALVHDVLNQMGGAEKVLENFLEIWPDATIYTVFYDEQKTDAKFARFRKQVSWLDKMPLAHTHPRLFVALLPGAFEGFDFSGFDVVISDSSAFAKFACPNQKLHISYIHTPTRFLWTEPEYLKMQKYPSLFKFFGSWFLPRLKRQDYTAAQRPQFLIANSINVQNRIKRYYHRDSVVIPPPVDTNFYKPQTNKQEYFFTVSRLEPYKKINVIIDAFNQTGLPLKIAGTGTIETQLKSLAKPNIQFLGRVSDDELRRHYSVARAFVFAANEDAGITLLEAQACGTPVIAYRAGGALESVIEGQTGEFFDAQTPESLIGVLKQFDNGKYNSRTIRRNAEQFSKEIFQRRIKKFVEEKYNEFSQAIR